MADDDISLRQRKEFRDGIIRERRAFDRELELGAVPFPTGAGNFCVRPTLRKRSAVTGKDFFIRRGVLGCNRKVQLKFGASRDADFFADEPARFSRKLHRGCRQRRRRRYLLKQQHFIVITVDLDVARLVELERDRPLDFAGLPTVGQLPFHLGGDAGVARKFPVGVPVRNHAEEQADGERLAGNDGVDIRDEAGADQFAAFVSLGAARAQKSQKQDRREKSAARRAPRIHAVTYHRGISTAT